MLVHVQHPPTLWPSHPCPTWRPLLCRPLLLPQQSREPLVSGLVEALRLTPPRVAPHQPPDLTRRLWSIARAYWMQAGPTAATAAAQQLLSSPAAAAAGEGHSSGGGDVIQGTAATAAAAAAGVGSKGPKLGPLLAELQSKAAGGVLSKQQLAAAQALVAARGEDSLRRVSVVSALWGLASLGGPLFFTQEVEALCQVCVGGGEGGWRGGGTGTARWWVLCAVTRDCDTDVLRTWHRDSQVCLVRVGRGGGTWQAWVFCTQEVEALCQVAWVAGWLAAPIHIHTYHTAQHQLVSSNPKLM
jgi:hypothetical protein